MSAQLYPSTKALSVYNTLSLSRRDLTRTEIVASLQEHYDASVDEAWVTEGIAFLVERALAVVDGEQVAPGRPRAPDGRCWPLRRAKADTELRWA